MKTLFHQMTMHYAPVFEFTGPDPEEDAFDPREANDPEDSWDDQEEDDYDEDDDGNGAYDDTMIVMPGAIMARVVRSMAGTMGSVMM